jgi:error-prone DNA polymerase
VTGYAELHCLSNFTFLRGASHPGELVEQAVRLGYDSIALTDECSVAGIVRAHVAVEACVRAVKLIVGSEFRLACGIRFVALAPDRRAYGQLCGLITRGRRAAAKGSYTLERSDARAVLETCLILWLPDLRPDETAARWLRDHCAGNLWIATELLLGGNDRRRLADLERLGATLGLPLVASGDVHMHVRERHQLQDVLTAIRHKVPLAETGQLLHANGERHLRPLRRLVKLYPPELLEETLRIAERCRFRLDELGYEYPHELVPRGMSPSEHLRELTEEGARRRWPAGVPSKVRKIIEGELALIGSLGYEPYFLTVHDIVKYAREKEILCQGRGSAANSAVCYCLEVTAVDPDRMSVLMGRFISSERHEPPDIDIDFEHERREEIIQYVYGKYGRDRAALAATVIRYKPRSALRDVGKAFGLDQRRVDRLSKALQWWDELEELPRRARELGFDPSDSLIGHVLRIVGQLQNFPRHLSQHVGGFVISHRPLEELVPIENASMPERTVVQWDKDDLNDLGLLKVDLLSLGMLTALHRAFDLVKAYRRAGYHDPARLELGCLPKEDARVYEMLRRADTVGVFQVESRAQMSMLPRLRPKEFYDLVVQVAIVRPGPIQGDMVHPYLQRRENPGLVDYPGPEVRAVLERTLGVPIFQEQVMQLAIVAAGFTSGEADQLRRAMGAWERKGDLKRFRDKLIEGMRARNYSESFAERIYRQIEGFGEYGFPEAHAISFALLAYDSAWLKCYEPAAFTCALLNSQPMGFYQPAQLVRDAREHGVQVRPVSVEESVVECSLERGDFGEPALRLGLNLVSSFPRDAARRLVEARRAGPFASVEELARRASLDRGELEALAAAGAFAGLSGHRHLAFWDVAGHEPVLPLDVTGAATARWDGAPLLRTPTSWENVLADYRALGLTLGAHPMKLVREQAEGHAWVRAADLASLQDGAPVQVAGIVLMRQHPQSAKGVTFLTIEDETGSVNIIVWRSIGDRDRRAMVESMLLEVEGELQRENGVTHVVAQRLLDRSSVMGELITRSRDFH